MSARRLAALIGCAGALAAPALAHAQQPTTTTTTPSPATPAPAAALLQRAFPGVAAYDPQSSVAPMQPGPQTRYRSASVATQPGELTISSAPLRAPDATGTLVPLSLALEPRGTELAPQAAPLDLRLGAGPAPAMTLGPTADQAVTVTPTGLDAGAQAPQMLDGKALYAGTRPATDTLLTQQIDGLDRLELLRDASAPEQLTYQLTLAPGLVARQDDQAIVVTDATGVVQERMLPPRAFDANSAPVPTSVSLQGDQLTVTISHRAAAPTYPVASAMTWTSQYDWQGNSRTGFEGWGLAQDAAPNVPPGPYYQGFLGGGSRGPGIELDPIGGRIYSNGNPTTEQGGPRIIAQVGAPGTTTIRSARFSHVDFLNDREGQVLRLALYGPDGYGETRDLRPPDYLPGQAYQDRGPFNVGPPPTGKTATSAQIWLFTVCAADQPGRPFECPNVAQPSRSFGRVGAVTLTLNDTERPDVTVTGPLTERRWTQGRGTAQVTLAASDPGSGIDTYRLVASSPGRDRRTVIDAQASCDPDHARPGEPGREAAVCPTGDTRTASESLSRLPEGTTRYDAIAQDLSGQQTASTFSVGVDRTGPRLTADGPLLRAPSEWASLTRPIPVSVVARDSLSGVQSVRLRVVGSSGTAVDVTRSLCASGSSQCDRERSTSLSLDPSVLADGTYAVTLSATDLAGNESSPRTIKRLKLDRQAPSTVRGSLSREGTAVVARFDPAEDPSPSSGIDEYRARARRGLGGAYSSWQPVSERRLTLSASRDAFVQVQVYAVDQAGNAGPVTDLILAPDAAIVRLAAGLSDERLLELTGIDQLERYANTAGIAASNGARAAALRATLRTLGRIAARASVLGDILAFFTSVDDAGCDEPPGLLPVGRAAFGSTADAIRAAKAVTGADSAAAAAARGSALARLDRAYGQVTELRRRAAGQTDFADPCSRLPKLYVRVIDQAAGPALLAAADHVREEARRPAYDYAQALINRAPRLAPRQCSQARELKLPVGPEKRNYQVYWSPPAPPGARVLYVGITRNLVERCRKHPASRRGALYTLALPPLSHAEAKSVEEALIAHFGPQGRKGDEVGNNGERPQLQNIIHSVRPERPDYCDRLLIGQYTLALAATEYRAYTPARFTRRVVCPGI